jgi:hypothetical protein
MVFAMSIQDPEPDDHMKSVSDAIDRIDADPVPVTVRRAWRISQRLGHSLESMRFAMELGSEDRPADGVDQTGLVGLRFQAWAMVLDERQVNFDPSSLGIGTVQDLSLLPLDSLQARLEVVPHERELSLRTRMERQNQRAVATIILNRLRISTLRYLMEVERTLRLSKTGETIFENHRKRVDDRLRVIAPEILDQLNSAIRRAHESEDQESRAQALTSCRRVLVAIADLVFPARDEAYVDSSGHERPVGNGQYRNRLVAFVESRGSNTLNTALIGSVVDFADRIDALDGLTQKGVHSAPSAEDVDFGVIQTYILSGEILRLLNEEVA